MHGTPFPHFSYHVANCYDSADLDRALAPLIADMAPLRARTGGLGVFSGAAPVLFVAVVRTAELSALHRMVTAAVTPAAHGPVAYYEPEQWIPHITLAMGDTDAERVAAAMRLLADRDFTWEVEVDTLAWIAEAPGGQALRTRWQLGARPRGLAGGGRPDTERRPRRA